MMDWRRNPLLWLKERFGEEPLDFQWSKIPGYENHKWDGSVDPLAGAWIDIAAAQWAAIEAATGTSKTYFLSRLVFWFLDVYEDSLVVTSAPKEAQLRLHLWSEISKAFYKFKKIRPHSELQKLKIKVDNRQPDNGDDPDLSESWQAVGFVSGTGTEEESSTKAQGFHRKDMLIIIEETPGVSRAVMTAFKNTCTGENNVICAVGNPDHELDPLHQFASLATVKAYTISAYDYPNVVLGNAAIPGAVTRASIERRRVEYGDESAMYLSRVRGISPKQGTNSLIMLSWIEQCEWISTEAMKPCYNAAGVDVSNSDSGDKAAVAYGEGPALISIKEFACPNATHLAYNLIYDDFELARQDYKRYGLDTIHQHGIPDYCVGIDAVGVGVATINALTDLHYTPVALQGGQWDDAIPQDQEGKPMYRFASLRAQMYFEAREDLRKKEVSIRIEDQAVLLKLKKELVVPRFDLRDSTIAVERKDKIKERLGHSPNLADAFVYWNWSRKGYLITGSHTAAIG